MAFNKLKSAVWQQARPVACHYQYPYNEKPEMHFHTFYYRADACIITGYSYGGQQGPGIR